jgi:hypothetical protein
VLNWRWPGRHKKCRIKSNEVTWNKKRETC